MSEKVLSNPKSLSQYPDASSQFQSHLHLLPVVGERDEEFNNDVVGGADLEVKHES